MTFEEELKNNFRNLKLEVLEDIVQNKKEEYTEEAYKIAITELTAQTSEEFVNTLIESKITENNQLNWVNEYPDDEWTPIFSSVVSTPEIIHSNKVTSCINWLKEHYIHYKSYLHNCNLTIFIKLVDLDYISEFLFKKEFETNKELSEIEEFKGVDINKSVEDEIKEFNEFQEFNENIKNTSVTKNTENPYMFLYVILFIIFTLIAYLII